MSNKMWHDYVKKYMADHNVTYAVASKLAKPSYKVYKSKKAVIPKKNPLEDSSSNPIEDLPTIEDISSNPIEDISSNQIENLLPSKKDISSNQIEDIPSKKDISSHPIEDLIPTESISGRIAPYICFIQIFFLYLWT